MSTFVQRMFRKGTSRLVSTLTIAALVVSGSAMLGIFNGSEASAIRHTPPSVGRIPQSAFQNGRIDASQVPDFVPALDQQGNVVGYVRKSDILPTPAGSAGYSLQPSPASKGPVPVYDSSLTSVVGYMDPGFGFVPVGSPLPAGTPSSVTTTTMVTAP